MDTGKSFEFLDLDFDPVPSGNLEPFLDQLLGGAATLQPMDGSLQVLHPAPAPPLSFNTPLLGPGMTGLYQQQQDSQRHNSYTGWLTNQTAMPSSSPAGQQQYEPGHSLGGMGGGDLPGALSFDLQMLLEPEEQPSGNQKGGAHTQQQVEADQRLRSLDSQLSGTSHGHEQQHQQHMLPNSQGGSNENSGQGDMEEGLSKEGLRALRDARNREKNKRAQKLFRERSKMKAKENEVRVKELVEELRISEEENERQAQRILVLESALVLRQPVDARVLPCGGCHSLQPKGQPKEGSSMEPFQPYKGWEDFDPSNTLLLTAKSGKPLMLAPQDVQRLTWEEFKDVWKDYVNQLAMCLLDSNNDVNTPAGQRLVGLNNECSALCACIALNNPKLIHKFTTTCLENDTTLLDPPNMRRWSAIMKSVGLTPDEKKLMLRHRRNFLTTFEMLMKERKKAEADLVGVVLTPERLDAANLSPEFLRLMEATERMNRIVEECHRTACRFMALGWREVLNPLQSANFIVQSYPWGPDLMSLGNAVAAEAGEAPGSVTAASSAFAADRHKAPTGLVHGSDEMRAILLQRQGLLGPCL